MSEQMERSQILGPKSDHRGAVLRPELTKPTQDIRLVELTLYTTQRGRSSKKGAQR